MKIKILLASIIVLIGGLLSVLIFAINDPVFMAGGSDALDVTTAPAPIGQWIALVFYLVVFLFLVFARPSRSGSSLVLKTILASTSLAILLVSGHTYTVSGKSNTLEDKWFGVSMQVLKFDPSEGLADISVERNKLTISILQQGKVEQTILIGPFIWGVRDDSLITILEDFGASIAKE
ncbi:hypothetical protein [Hahella sp. CCB-MM4]|uniref:hypothetical protein n=1 Tax=Hahella sp. (strain CCB-MM4) TaxID=1926491 RepID=UPI001140307A|nr:hypothetical protein [Hahella sp. CCB-MM4]